MPLSRESAEVVGLKALTWLSSQEDVLTVFMGSTGAASDDLRNGARDPAFLGAVLDFILMDDAWVQAMCDHAGIAYDQPMAARAMLPGGEAVHWT
ncbi:DUF3572 domain-containing protein [Tateyamaria sp. SN6-1]|uniref:DUF3572 domain-containing protein n=1 Tax=Tateyamaria sp. SN6-1 TaxID=3092148 RepID=UPI0039F46CBD